jgi:hypothetical protein
MSSLVKYFVVLPFSVNKHGRLVPGNAREAASENEAIRVAQRHAHAIAFYRTGDATTGDWDDAVIFKIVGSIPTSIIEAMAA